MQRFLIKTGLFILSLITLYAAVWFLVTPEKEQLGNDFMAAMIDKHKRANEIGSPKIVIAGGSNIAFNINSEKVQKELGIPVVNLGLNVGLGLNFMLEELKDVSVEGDTVFLFLTYFLDLDGNYALKKHTAKHYTTAQKYYQLDLKEEVIIHTRDTRNHLRNKMVSVLLGNIIKTETEIKGDESIYTRNNFDKFGDLEGHHGLEPPADLDQRHKFEYRYWQGIEQLNIFMSWAEKNNITAYYLFTAFPKTEFQKNEIAFKKFEDDLRKNSQIKILGEPEIFLFDEDYFFDTVYHLNKSGRKKRTTLFLELLETNRSEYDS